jgi:L-ascorbate metabolism protein UlaG (beta-lactamase superfamily)
MARHRDERIHTSKQFEDGRFHNSSGKSAMTIHGGVLPMVRDYAQATRKRPPGPVPMSSPLSIWKEAPPQLRVTWLGHSTMLIELDGVRILTDPVFGLRASPVSFAGPKRFHPPPVALDDLPPLDAIVVSHNHYDHLDAETLPKLFVQHPQALVVTSLGVGAQLEQLGVNRDCLVELDWWEETSCGAVAITATPGQHFSGRGVLDRNATLWSGFVFGGRQQRMFFSGDTGLAPEFAEIRQRLGSFDLVALEVGAFHPSWRDIHLGPDQAMTAHQQLGGGAFLPVHWGTFDLAIHPWDEPAIVLSAAAATHQLPMVMPRVGGVVDIPKDFDGIIDPWWRTIAG